MAGKEKRHDEAILIVLEPMAIPFTVVIAIPRANHVHTVHTIVNIMFMSCVLHPL